ncbi:hypothetical protein BWZ20_09905 [Winogradskyella sp. J14-2]|uniref:FISUMP domain-containing protein n=1 Tax=Winogradskyella sp. J14-2 TaxID=1936080 RepID=UPI000972789E|nr:FISUMP domain-containing protein [Winogradskyella sp. J14-2]APY08594.1 hypothetical protein BWZ20_09905 [Winogradskyella sp. J14-2]
MHKLFNLLFLIFFGLGLISCNKDEDNTDNQNPDITLMDADGNVYETITLGNQVWMAENLKTTTFNDGSSITEYRHFMPNQSPFDWFETSNPRELFQWAFTEDLNDIYPEDLPIDFYGAHYNNEAIQSGKLDIDGWRLPTIQDFEELISFLVSEGHIGNEATVLKTQTGWAIENGTDLYDFTVKPAGNTINNGTPDFSELLARLCTSNTNTTLNQRTVATFFNNGEISFEEIDIRNGFSIRYIKE